MTFLTPRTIELNDEFLHFENEFFQCPNLPHAPLNVEKTHFYSGKKHYSESLSTSETSIPAPVLLSTFFWIFFIMTDPTTFYLFPYEKEQKSRQKMTVVTDEPLGNTVFCTFKTTHL